VDLGWSLAELESASSGGEVARRGPRRVARSSPLSGLTVRVGPCAL